MMLELQQVRVAIGAYPILRGVDLRVEAGEVVALVGRNGAGKTTTLRSIMGLLPLEGGEMQFRGDDLRAIPAYQRAARGFGYMPEDRRLIDPLSVEQNILVPAWATGIDDAQTRLERVYERLPAVRDAADRQAVYLSGGQQKLVAFARALMTADSVLILDEPFEGVASSLTDDLYAVLNDLRDDGVSTLVASTTRQLTDFADRVYRIERGEITDSN